MSAKLFGKYRGVVLENRDPEQMGRIRAQVPGLLGTIPTGWAMPCVPLNAARGKLGSALPRVGAAVWIEFEQGDPDHPVWTGFFFNAAKVPASLRHR